MESDALPWHGSHDCSLDAGSIRPVPDPALAQLQTLFLAIFQFDFLDNELEKPLGKTPESPLSCAELTGAKLCLTFNFTPRRPPRNAVLVMAIAVETAHGFPATGTTYYKPRLERAFQRN